MDARITDQPAFHLVGHAFRARFAHTGVNTAVQERIAALPPEEHARLKDLSAHEPHGLLQVSADVDPEYREGTDFTYLHGVAVAADAIVPADLDAIDVDPGPWVVFRTSGPYPAVVQDAYAASAAEWFPSNPWRLRPGPSIVAIVDRAEDFSTATCELWLPIEPQ